VDGIYVNSSDETIVILQTTISQKANSTIGDKSLREFAGILTQFRDAAAIAEPSRRLLGGIDRAWYREASWQSIHSSQSPASFRVQRQSIQGEV
jgi:hypothetical protein